MNALPILSTYIRRRGAVYQFRIAVPMHLRAFLGKKEYNKSLGTKDQREAKRLGSLLYTAIVDYFEAATAAMQRGAEAASVPLPASLQPCPSAHRKKATAPAALAVPSPTPKPAAREQTPLQLTAAELTQLGGIYARCRLNSVVKP